MDLENHITHMQDCYHSKQQQMLAQDETDNFFGEKNKVGQIICEIHFGVNSMRKNHKICRQIEIKLHRRESAVIFSHELNFKQILRTQVKGKILAQQFNTDLEKLDPKTKEFLRFEVKTEGLFDQDSDTSSLRSDLSC